MKSEIEVPDGWILSKLSDLCIKVQSGGTPKSTIKEYYDGDIPFVKIEDLTIAGKNLYKTKTRITKEGLNNSSAWFVPKNSILYSMYASLGILSINRISVATNQAILNLIVDSKKCSLEYLYYFLLSYKRQLNRFISETTQKNLNAKKVRNFDILLPSSMNEQQKIADILSKVDEQIDFTEKIIDKTEELKIGLMRKLITKGIGHAKFKKSKMGLTPEKWNLIRLGALTKKVGSGITPRGGSSVYLDIGIPLLRSQNVLKGTISIENVAYISNDQHKKMKNTQLRENDVLLNITGASIGRSAVVPKSIKEGNVNQHVCIIRLKNGVNSAYISSFLNSYFGQKQIKGFQAGSSREGLNFQQIKSFTIPLPSLNEQKQIASILSKVDEQIQDNKKELKHLHELKKGLMQDLLTGKVRVTT